MSSTIEKQINNFDIKFIYDIFHNDKNKLIIIMPAEFVPPDIKYINSKLNLEFKLHSCPHKHTFIYETLAEIKYTENIQLLINDKIYDVKVNKYPEFKDEIIMSTMVYNEDNYIRQWINFHLNIGITRFIIYDNSKINDNLSYKSIEETSNLKKVLSDFIEKKIVILIEWSYPKRLKKSGISGQTTQQNHSIYAFKNSKYIGLFDIDEYVNMQNNTNIDNFFNLLITKQKLDINKIGGFKIKNKDFTNPDNLSTNEYDFLSIFSCKEITKIGRMKSVVIPNNVNTYSVHIITSGKRMYNVDFNDLYFNHYIFLNKSNRGKDITNLEDNSIMEHCKFIEHK